MSETLFFCHDPMRGFIKLGGPDRYIFLQGLISNDINKVTESQVIWSALLTPQGKFLHDFFISSHGDNLMIACEKDRLVDLGQRLRKFKLRADIALSIADKMHNFLVWGHQDTWQLSLGEIRQIADQCWLYADPRLAKMGWRLMVGDVDFGRDWLLQQGGIAASRRDWDRNRLGLAIPDGSRDCTIEKAILLEYGFDELGGLDWKKGCYMGQELTARTKYRGLIRKRFLSIYGETDIAEQALIKQPEALGGREIGQVSSSAGRIAGALIRMDRLPPKDKHGFPVTIDDAVCHVQCPEWITYQSG